MKKYLIYLVVFSSLFFIVSKVNASSYNMVINDEDLRRDTIKTYEEIAAEGYDYTKALEFFDIDSSKEDYVISLQNKIIYCNKWNKEENVKGYHLFRLYSGTITGTSYLAQDFILWHEEKQKVITQMQYNLETKEAKNNGKTNQYRFTTSSFKGQYKKTDNYEQINLNFYENSSGYFIETSINYVRKSSLPDYTKNIYGDTLSVITEDLEYYYINGDIIFTSKLKFAYEKTSYNYEGIINATELFRIEFEFTVPNQEFEFNFDFLTQYPSFMPRPYLEAGINGETEINNFLNEEEEVNAEDEYGEEIYQFEKKIEFLKQPKLDSLKLVFDVSGITGNIYVKFESNLPFELKTYKTVDEMNNLMTIDMRNKVGLYLWPKTLHQDVFSNISMGGRYDINVIEDLVSEDNYKLKETIKSYNSNKWQITNLQYHFKVGEIYKLLYFENIDYGKEDDNFYYITFDTRYFNYAIKENYYDDVSIVNPNTGETITLSYDFGSKALESPTDVLEYIGKIFQGNKDIFNNAKIIYSKFKKTRIGLYIFIIIIVSLTIWLIKVIRK